jgi:hypothetical protein
MLVGVPLFLVEMQEHENKWGFLVTLLDFIWTNFITNLAFIQIELLLFFKLWNRFIIWGNFGLWTSTIIHIVNRCLENPRGYTNYYLFPRRINNLTYLSIIILIFSVLSGGLPMVVIDALMVGVIHNSYKNSVYSWMTGKNPIESYIEDHTKADSEESASVNQIL